MSRFNTKLGGYNEVAVDYALDAFVVAVEIHAQGANPAPLADPPLIPAPPDQVAFVGSNPTPSNQARGAAGGNSSVGRASAFQAECRGFESRFPLQHEGGAKTSSKP